uniref:Uncharacterized protein n=1 Tax=Leersia perrieri TaxID=77586 RepID=A0A0D9WQG7_9ORYZ
MASCLQQLQISLGAGRCSSSSLAQRLLVIVVVSMVAIGVAPGVANGAENKSRFKAIFMFGDSIVDPGNNNGRLTEARADFPPYGQDFPGGVATGRFSNGKVPGDLLASKLGIKELLPPYNNQDLELSDLLTGVAFASGGSGYDPLTSGPSTAISSSGQLDLFSDYKQKLTSLIGEEAMTRVISEAVFFTVMGANDILNNYFTLPVRRHQYDIASYIEFLVSNAVDFTLKMNAMGAKMIAFVGVPPLGCCPSQRTGPSRECEPLRNQASELFNTRIKQELDKLNAESTDGSRFVYIDIYYNLLDLIQRPGYYGFKDTSDGCCGNSILNAAIFIKYHSACPNVYDYIFWDSFHPSEKAYNIVVDNLIQQNQQYLM